MFEDSEDFYDDGTDLEELEENEKLEESEGNAPANDWGILTTAPDPEENPYGPDEYDEQPAPSTAGGNSSRESQDVLTLVARASGTGVDADTAMEKLLSKNLCIVERLARKYADPSRLSLEYLTEVGKDALREAIKSYDETKGMKLSSFAWNRIKHRMLDAKNDAFPSVRTNKSERARLYEKLLSDYRANNDGSEPSDTELLDFASKQAKASPGNKVYWLSGRERWNPTYLDEARCQLRQSNPPTSLDAPMQGDEAEDGDGTFSDALTVEEDPSKEFAFDYDESEKRVVEAITSMLAKKQKDVAIGFYIDPIGFMDPKSKTRETLRERHVNDRELMDLLRKALGNRSLRNALRSIRDY